MLHYVCSIVSFDKREEHLIIWKKKKNFFTRIREQKVNVKSRTHTRGRISKELSRESLREKKREREKERKLL